MEKLMEIEDFDKQWKELGISNDFLFMKVMQNPELCKELLHRILPDLDIDHIEYPELQKEIKEDMEAKSVRLDVYVKGSKGIIYTFENLCKEDASLAMGDEATKIFLNAKGNINDVGNELKAFLDYVAGKKSNDVFVDKLEEAVQKAKKNREWKHDYMTLMMRERINYEKGQKHGEKNERNKIIFNMVEQGYSNEQIMAVCGVSEEEVEECRNMN